MWYILTSITSTHLLQALLRMSHNITNMSETYLVRLPINYVYVRDNPWAAFKFYSLEPPPLRTHNHAFTLKVHI